MLNTLKRLLRKQDGLAYLEFAISLPFLLALLLGSIEVTRYILIAQKVEKTAVTISDVVAQSEDISTSELDSIIYAAAQVMQPYTFNTNGYVIITSVTQNGSPSISNPPTIKWRYEGGGTWVQPSNIGSGVGATANLPGNLSLNNKDNIIITEVFYNYAPIIVSNTVISGGSIYKVGVFKPRLGDLSTLGG